MLDCEGGSSALMLRFSLSFIFCLCENKEKKIYFKIHTRRGSRARKKALLTIAAIRDVVDGVWSCVHSVVIDLVRGTSVAPAHLFLLFSSLHLSSLFFQCLSLILLFFSNCFF